MSKWSSDDWIGSVLVAWYGAFGVTFLFSSVLAEESSFSLLSNCLDNSVIVYCDLSFSDSNSSIRDWAYSRSNYNCCYTLISYLFSASIFYNSLSNN